MVPRWSVMLERFRKRQRFVTCCSRPVTDYLPYRQFSSDIVFPTISSKDGRGSTRASQERDPGLFYLTQLFGKFLKLGEDTNAYKLIKDMKSLDSPVTSVVCNYLLNSCSKSRNPKMAKEVWNFMKSNNVLMNEVSYGCLLGALSRGGCLDEAVELVELLARNRGANVVMYNTVLNGCMHAKSKVHAERCVQLMEKQGVLKNELSYVELIKLSGMLGDVKSTKKWWTVLVSSFIPSPSARSSYIIALCRMNALTEARQILQDMVSALGRGDAMQSLLYKEAVVHQQSNNLFDRKDEEAATEPDVEKEVTELSSDLNTPNGLHIQDFHLEPESQEEDHSHGRSTSVGSEDGVSPFTKERTVDVLGFPTELPLQGYRLQDFISNGLKELQNAYNAMINAAGKGKNHLLAEALFSEMRQLGLKMDIYTYNALLRAVVEGRGVEHALRIVKRMEAIGVRPNVYSFTAILEGYCQTQQLNRAEAVLEYMENGNHSQRPSCHTYNTLLKACAAAEDPERALQVFARMKESRVLPDICTYITLFSVLGSDKAGLEGYSPWSQQEVAKRVAALEMDMAQSGVQHTRESITSLMHVLGGEGMMEAMLQRLKSGNSNGNDLLDVTSYNTVIFSCVNSKQVETAWKVYQEMKSFGVKPDVYTYNILINGCSYDKDVSTAFELVDTMRQEGIDPDLVTFNTLLKVICHSGKMDVVLDLLQEMTTSGVEPDTTTFNTILTSASYHTLVELEVKFSVADKSSQRRVDVMEHIVEEMRRRNITPDQHTFLPVVSIYMHLGQTDDAVEALRILSLRMLEGAQLSCDAGNLHRKQVQDVLGDLARKNLNLGTNTRELLKDAVLHTSPESLAIYIAALAGLVQGDSDSGKAESSPWASRLSMQYDRQNISKLANCDLG